MARDNTALELTNYMLEISPLSLSDGFTVSFRGFILDSFKDSYAINTNSEVLFGRTDPFRTYTNTERTITFGITVHSDGQSDIPNVAAEQNFSNLQNLIRGAYPSYNKETKALATPPLFRVFMTNFIVDHATQITDTESIITARTGLVGYFDDISFEYQDPAGYSNVPYGKESGEQIPRVFSLNFSFHPLHSDPIGALQQGSSFEIPDYLAYFPYGSN